MGQMRWFSPLPAQVSQRSLEPGSESSGPHSAALQALGSWTKQVRCGPKVRGLGPGPTPDSETTRHHTTLMVQRLLSIYPAPEAVSSSFFQKQNLPGNAGSAHRDPYSRKEQPLKILSPRDHEDTVGEEVTWVKAEGTCGHEESLPWFAPVKGQVPWGLWSARMLSRGRGIATCVRPPRRCVTVLSTCGPWTPSLGSRSTHWLEQTVLGRPSTTLQQVHLGHQRARGGWAAGGVGEAVLALRSSAWDLPRPPSVSFLCAYTCILGHTATVHRTTQI